MLAIWRALIMVLALCPLSAFAQSTPPDVVRLHDGTFLRGTIVERSPTQVIVMLPTGETRTYAADEVEFAGPDQPPPVLTPPAPPVPQGFVVPMQNVARVRVVTEQQGLSLQQLQGSTTVTVVTTGGGVGSAQVDQFSVICNAPCETQIPAGTYQLGVAQGSGNAMRAGPPIDLRGDVTLRIAYEDRSVYRAMGWVTFGLGVAAVATTTILAATLSPEFDIGMFLGGAIGFGVSIIAFWALVFLNDAPSVEQISPEGIRF